ncbi:MAG: hypothetical protein AAGG51_08430 [Cyanobacteria bacterium P01_G01_bin.54]
MTLEEAAKEITRLKRQLATVRASNENQQAVIDKLTVALELLTTQYHSMMQKTDQVIAFQAEKIEQLQAELNRLQA